MSRIFHKKVDNLVEYRGGVKGASLDKSCSKRVKIVWKLESVFRRGCLVLLGLPPWLCHGIHVNLTSPIQALPTNHNCIQFLLHPFDYLTMWKIIMLTPCCECLVIKDDIIKIVYCFLLHHFQCYLIMSRSFCQWKAWYFQFIRPIKELIFFVVQAYPWHQGRKTHYYKDFVN